MAIIGQKIHSDFVAFHAPKQVYIYISWIRFYLHENEMLLNS
jgi:hypothetical protein